MSDVDRLETERFRALAANVASQQLKEAIHIYYNKERKLLIDKVKGQLENVKVTEVKKDTSPLSAIHEMTQRMSMAQTLANMAALHQGLPPMHPGLLGFPGIPPPALPGLLQGFPPMMSSAAAAAGIPGLPLPPGGFPAALHPSHLPVTSQATPTSSSPPNHSSPPHEPHPLHSATSDLHPAHSNNSHVTSEKHSVTSDLGTSMDSSTDDSFTLGGPKRKFLHSSAINVLNAWYEEHSNHPYPDEETVEELATKANISCNQVRIMSTKNHLNCS